MSEWVSELVSQQASEEVRECRGELVRSWRWRCRDSVTSSRRRPLQDVGRDQPRLLCRQVLDYPEDTRHSELQADSDWLREPQESPGQVGSRFWVGISHTSTLSPLLEASHPAKTSVGPSIAVPWGSGALCDVTKG